MGGAGRRGRVRRAARAAAAARARARAGAALAPPPRRGRARPRAAAPPPRPRRRAAREPGRVPWQTPHSTVSRGSARMACRRRRGSRPTLRSKTLASEPRARARRPLPGREAQHTLAAPGGLLQPSCAAALPVGASAARTPAARGRPERGNEAAAPPALRCAPLSARGASRPPSLARAALPPAPPLVPAQGRQRRPAAYQRRKRRRPRGWRRLCRPNRGRHLLGQRLRPLQKPRSVHTGAPAAAGRGFGGGGGGGGGERRVRQARARAPRGRARRGRRGRPAGPRAPCHARRPRGAPARGLGPRASPRSLTPWDPPPPSAPRTRRADE